jgi:hypothetical protein
MQMLINRCESPDKGAPPHSMNRICPPIEVLILLKTRTSHNILSNPQAPSQLPSMADSRRLYAMLNRCFTNPPFSSTLITS